MLLEFYMSPLKMLWEYEDVLVWLELIYIFISFLGADLALCTHTNFLVWNFKKTELKLFSHINIW